jgi:hypothetical protein
VVGALGGAALSLFLSFSVTGGNLALIPWFTVGIALLFLVAWALVFRATGRRWRQRYRLDAFAAANGLTLEHDVTRPERGWEVYGGGTEPKLMVRLVGRDPLGAYEVGIRSRVEPTPTGGTHTVETPYLITSRPDDGGPDQIVFFDTLVDLGQPDSWRRIQAASSAATTAGRVDGTA